VRVERGLLHRSAFPEAVTWLEIHGDRPEAVAHWRQLQQQAAHPPASVEEAADHPFRRRRRRRRRRAPFVAE
jgi:hypothetical protein